MGQSLADLGACSSRTAEACAFCSHWVERSVNATYVNCCHRCSSLYSPGFLSLLSTTERRASGSPASSQLFSGTHISGLPRLLNELAFFSQHHPRCPHQTAWFSGPL